MPRMLDLFCGRGGWTKGFLAEGWECVGIDLNPQPHYPTHLICADMLTVDEDYIAAINPDFICASSPCEEFSIHCMKHFHPNPKYPEMGIKLFNHTRSTCELSGKPYLMENVRGAVKFVGPAVNHCGPFYLWGNAVPAVMPKAVYQLRKGFDLGSSAVVKGMSREEITAYRRKYDRMWSSSKSKERKEATAQAAEIPIELSRYVAQCASALVTA